MARGDAGEKDVQEQTQVDSPPPHSEKEEEAPAYVPRDFFIFPVPKHLRHDPEKPAHFGMFLNIVFALATTFSAYSAVSTRG